MKSFYFAFLDNINQIKDNEKISPMVRLFIVGFFVVVPFSVTTGAIILLLKSFFDSRKK